jgi:hypothetical protein
LGDPVLHKKEPGPKDFSSGYGTAANFQSQSILQNPQMRLPHRFHRFYSLSKGTRSAVRRKPSLASTPKSFKEADQIQ